MEMNVCHRLIKSLVESGVIITQFKMIPLGLYATKQYQAGEVVHRLEGTLRLTPTKTSVHIGNGMHITDKFGSYMNHSFEPNTKIVSNQVIAIKDIAIHEEITFDYNESEVNMAEPFEVDGVWVKGKETI